MSAGGILPGHEIAALVDKGAITAERPLVEGQIQPASLDLRLGSRAFRVRASFLPGPHRTVAQRLFALGFDEIDLYNKGKGALLERNCVYVAEIEERLKLPDGLSAAANPKSSTGRLDVFTRIIADHADRFDLIKPGYSGTLYAEVSPRTFPIIAHRGSRLAQMRFRTGEARLNDHELAELHAREVLVAGSDLSLSSGVPVSIDLAGAGAERAVGYRAKSHTVPIDVDRVGDYDAKDFWDELTAHKGGLVLDPDEFYILASKEAVHVPPDYAAEMMPFDPLVGEFRVHYAGFFDPGFGHAPAGGHGSRAVLEVRSRDVPFILEDGQTVARLVYERLSARPKMLYGTDLGSHYQAQGLKLSKHFRIVDGRPQKRRRPPASRLSLRPPPS
ncbi:MAG: 2'-deoxycytidine 5'-triphosphate deaminase [Hyphomicrobiales bacterium]